MSDESGEKINKQLGTKTASNTEVLLRYNSQCVMLKSYEVSADCVSLR